MQRFDDHPFLAIWETTQACDLTCKHCRACAKPARDSGELSTVEAKHLLSQLASAGVPLVVLTGGDPAKREDLVELIAYGHGLGLHMGLTPSATPLVTDELIDRVADAGLSRLAISIDGPDAATHDAFRGVTGTFAQALRILEHARHRKIPTQINTSIHAGNIGQLAEMVPLIRASGCALWSVFFVVPTGRATARMMPSPDTVEASLELLADIAGQQTFGVKTTAAPHYRRVLLARKAARSHATRGLRTLRINDGRGFMFISHRGDVYPSGFLPLYCGNIRENNPIDVYREHPIFRSLRDSDQLTGKCGVCEYRTVCGGSRARTYAATGALLGSDPLCSYVPSGYREDPSSRPRRSLAVLDG